MARGRILHSEKRADSASAALDRKEGSVSVRAKVMT
jgi:hypothetical protein